MRKIVSLILGTGLGANGFWMIVAPMRWYALVPGVSTTGPANAHFIRDIGCVYLVTAASVLWLAIEPRRGWPAALGGGLFLVLHAATHLWDVMAGRESLRFLLRDVPGVVLPGLIILWLVWPFIFEGRVK